MAPLLVLVPPLQVPGGAAPQGTGWRLSRYWWRPSRYLVGLPLKVPSGAPQGTLWGCPLRYQVWLSLEGPLGGATRYLRYQVAPLESSVAPLAVPVRTAP